MKTYSAPAANASRNNNQSYHYNEYNGAKLVPNSKNSNSYTFANGNSTNSYNHHWQINGPPSLTRRDRQILASAGINFSTLNRTKVLPKQTLPFAKNPNKTSNGESKGSSINQKTFEISTNHENGHNFNSNNANILRNFMDYPLDKNNFLRALDKQISSSILESSPPIKLFGDSNERNRKNAIFTGSRGLSIISSPAPIQCREDSSSASINQLSLNSFRGNESSMR